MTLIEKLEKLSDEYFNLYTCYGDRADLNCSGAVDEAIDIVKEHTDWNNVDDALPNENEIVLVYKQGFGEMGLAKYSANVFWAFDLNTNKHHFKSMSGVTHYKPLPPPSEVQDAKTNN